MLDRKIDMNMNDVDLDFLMKTLFRMSDVTTAYEVKDLKARRISIHAEGTTVRSVLDMVVAKHTDLEWKVVGGHGLVIGRKVAAPARK